jgi:hypothetical protein
MLATEIMARTFKIVLIFQIKTIHTVFVERISYLNSNISNQQNAQTSIICIASLKELLNVFFKFWFEVTVREEDPFDFS